MTSPISDILDKAIRYGFNTAKHNIGHIMRSPAGIPTEPIKISKVTEKGLREAEQAITALLEAATNLKIYDVDDSNGKEYQKGYNDMALAARLMLMEIRSNLGIPTEPQA